MSKRTRTLIAIGTIEVLLAGLWLWLAGTVAANPDRASPDAQKVIGETIGGAMGVLAGLTIPLYLLARKNDLKDGQK
ncbi:MAG TPA: hypothetical protein VGR62_07785 [Candidatus Binatia bacterium]|jgi:hypothetical protein|nr:hypothetical protein [Candidatus Binatia bacterium]